MRIVSFNVNGLRSLKEYYTVTNGWNFDSLLSSFNAEIICFQETKINSVERLERELALPKNYTGYNAFQKGVKRIGYSGVVTFCLKGKWEPLKYEEGFSGTIINSKDMIGGDCAKAVQSLLYPLEMLKVLDGEGRCMVTDHGDFVLFNVYFPHDSGPERLDFRSKFYPAIWTRCLELLRAGRSIILLGDINVTCHPIDHCDYSKAFQGVINRLGRDQAEDLNYRVAMAKPVDMYSSSDRLVSETFYKEKPMRGWLYRLLYGDEEAERFGLKDVFRKLYPEKFECYTCWNTLMSCRGTNHGTRIDTILVAGPLFQGPKEIILNCDIIPNFMGSDHCPVYMDLQLDPINFADHHYYQPAIPKNLRVYHNQKGLLEFFKSSKVIMKEEEDKFEPKVNADLHGQISKVEYSNLIEKGGKKIKLTDFFGIIKSKDSSSPHSNEIAGKFQPTESLPSKWIQCDQQKEGGALPLADEKPSLSLDKEDWKSIFCKPAPPPFCRGHNEPCKLLRVNKEGTNRGRGFYICSRGIKDSNDPNGRCNHFEWYKSNSRKGRFQT